MANSNDDQMVVSTGTVNAQGTVETTGTMIAKEDHNPIPVAVNHQGPLPLPVHVETDEEKTAREKMETEQKELTEKQASDAKVAAALPVVVVTNDEVAAAGSSSAALEYTPMVERQASPFDNAPTYHKPTDTSEG